MAGPAANPLRRIVILIGVFLAFLASGVIALRLWGGSTGDLADDTYRILSLFVLNGDWVFEEDANAYVVAQAFVAPVFTILGIIELFTRNVVRHVVQAIKLVVVKDHVILVGLTKDSILLLRSLIAGRGGKQVFVVDVHPDEELEAECWRLGAGVIVGDAGAPAVLRRAKLHRASMAVSFLSESADALQFVLSSDDLTQTAVAKNWPRAKNGVDLWLGLSDPSLGARLSEYFKFAGLSSEIHPRFFSLDEIAARQLIRAHPPDIYADAFDQDAAHLVIYGFNQMAVQVISEMLRQSVSGTTGRPRVTVMTGEPAEARSQILASLPGLDQVADIDVRELPVYPTGISDADYDRLPTDVTYHVICHSRTEKAASIALSLRRLLLTPPSSADADARRRLNRPILVRLVNNRGIGELLRSNVDRYDDAAEPGRSGRKNKEIPDGLFAFGAVEGLLSGDLGDLFIPTLIDTRREEIAKFIHYSYTYNRQTVAEMSKDPTNVERGRAERGWEKLAPEFRESCRQAADHVWAKARVLRFKISPEEAETLARADAALDLSTEENRTLARIEHQRWMHERLLSGWSYGEQRVDAARRHHLLRPWEELGEDEARLDTALATRLRDAVRAAGLELKRRHVIGVIGDPHADETPESYAALKAEIARLIGEARAARPDRALMVLTTLAPGAGAAAADAAIAAGVAYEAPLPLPFEAYNHDFAAKGAGAEAADPRLERFLRHVAASERYIELPLKFGDLTVVSRADAPARARQYALAAAYILERSDDLVVVDDGADPGGRPYAPANVAAWRKAGAAPPEFRSAPVFHERPHMSPPVIVRP